MLCTPLYAESVHAAKLKIITSHLKKDYTDEQNVSIEKVTRDIALIDNVIGLKDQISTNFKRESYLKMKYEFIIPERVVIKTVENKVFFYYQIPIVKSLDRLLKDNSLRRYIIHYPSPFMNTTDVSRNFISRLTNLLVFLIQFHMGVKNGSRLIGKTENTTLQSLIGKYRGLQGNPCNENRDPVIRSMYSRKFFLQFFFTL